jgi:hypothetical protein
MKKITNTLLIMVLFLLGSSISSWAQNVNNDPITVTFRVNTSTVPDTMNVDSVVQIRGTIEGLSDAGVTWDQNSVTATNVGGDYWEVDIPLFPGDVLIHKIWTGFDLENGAGYNGGWETNNPDPESDNYIFTVPADATEDIVTDVIYVARPDKGRLAPYESRDDYNAIHFRVNVGAAVATGILDPEDENHIVGVRGQLNEETGRYEYKFVIDKGGPNVTWESIDNRHGVFPNQDTTKKWSFFDNNRPPMGDVVTANLNFAVDMSVLEDLGFFNRGLGDKVFVRGQFNNWGESDELQFADELGLFTTTVEYTQEVGSKFNYKYYIRWDPSRFDSNSGNYIANLVQENGWEEPGTFGGSDRVATFTDDTNQDVIGDFGTPVAYFNSIPPQGVIPEGAVAGDQIDVTFLVDMTDAITSPELDATERFNPDTDDVYIIIDTPFFALTQGLPAGDDNPILAIPDQLERVKMSRIDNTNMYELVFPLQLPTENHIGFRLAFKGPDDKLFVHGVNFNPGRRYYRYITPDEVIGEDVFWPESYVLEEVVWKYENLDFPSPPDYGLGSEGNAKAKLFVSDESDYATSIDWGETRLVLTKEPRLSETSRNYFYSGTLYLAKTPTSVIDDNGDIPQVYHLDQNYPNPFNPTTTIRFTIPETQDVRLEVYSVLGQRVATLVNTQMTAGTHTVPFDAARLASGMYIYRLQAGEFVQQRKMMLVK